MRGCLRDKTLFLLHEGEGMASERAHLESCEACGRRYERLALDLEAIGRVLREEPPPQVFHSALFFKRWAPVLAAFAVGIALTWGAMWELRPTPAPESQPEVAADESVSQFSEEVSAALFATAGDNPAETAEPDPGFIYLEAAFGDQ